MGLKPAYMYTSISEQGVSSSKSVHKYKFNCNFNRRTFNKVLNACFSQLRQKANRLLVNCSKSDTNNIYSYKQIHGHIVDIDNIGRFSQNYIESCVMYGYRYNLNKSLTNVITEDRSRKAVL